MSRLRNRKVEHEVSVVPSRSKTKVVRKLTKPGSAAVRSVQVTTGPTAGTSTRRQVCSLVHSSQAFLAGSLTSNTSRPPGRSVWRIAVKTAAHS